MNRLKAKYNTEIVPSLKEKYNYKNVMEVPKLEKIVVNIGCGDATSNSKLLEAAMKDLEIITGQKPVATKAKKSIAGFKLREGQAIGCKVTLRGENMYNFLDKLISITLPRDLESPFITLLLTSLHGLFSASLESKFQS